MHLPGLARGLIIGGIGRINRLTSEHSDRQASIQAFYQCLRIRGYSSESLCPLFNKGIAHASSNTHVPRHVVDNNKGRIFLHLPFHPCNPSSHSLQRLFWDVLLSPATEPALLTMQNLNLAAIGINPMAVAYHRPNNLKNILFPRQLKEVATQPVSSILPGLPIPRIEQALDETC